ncbi:hypothetical protein Tco_0277309 [Tanacetum coccineum]
MIQAPLPTSTTIVITTTTTTSLPPPPPQSQQSTTYLILVTKAVDEIVTDAVDWAMQAPLRARFRDLPAMDMKEILQKRMFEDKSNEAHKDHKNLPAEGIGRDVESPRTPPWVSHSQPPLLSRAHRCSSTSGASGSSKLPLAFHLLHSTWYIRNQLRQQGSKAPSCPRTALAPHIIHGLTKSGTRDTSQLLLRRRCVTDAHNIRFEWTNPEGVQVRVDVSQPLPLGGPPAKSPSEELISKKHMIAKKDFKNMFPSDFEDLNLLLLQGHLDYLPGSNKRMLSTALDLKLRWDATCFEFKHDYTIIESPRAVVFPVDNNDQKIMRFNEIYKFSDGTLTRLLEALDYRVTEFKVKRLNPGIRALRIIYKFVRALIHKCYALHTLVLTSKFLESYVLSRVLPESHPSVSKSNLTEDGNPSRANIKQALGRCHWVFNSLVHSLCALSTLRCSGLRTASAAAKPCQGDSSEFYNHRQVFIPGLTGNVVLANLIQR